MGKLKTAGMSRADRASRAPFLAYSKFIPLEFNTSNTDACNACYHSACTIDSGWVISLLSMQDIRVKPPGQPIASRECSTLLYKKAFCHKCDLLSSVQQQRQVTEYFSMDKCVPKKLPSSQNRVVSIYQTAIDRHEEITSPCDPAHSVETRHLRLIFPFSIPASISSNPLQPENDPAEAFLHSHHKKLKPCQLSPLPLPPPPPTKTNHLINHRVANPLTHPIFLSSFFGRGVCGRGRREKIKTDTSPSGNLHFYAWELSGLR